MKRFTTRITALAFVAMVAACGQPPGDDAKGEGKGGAKEGAKGAAKAAARLVPVETIRVQRRSFEQRLVLSGQFEAVRSANVAVEMPGRVIDLRAKEGERVEADAILIRQDTATARAQLAQASAGVGQADAAVATARNQLNRSEKLAKSQVLDQARLDQARLGFKQAKAARQVAVASKQLAATTLKKLTTKAPLSGTVVRRNVEIGEVANPGMPLVTIADYSHMKLVVEVPERNVAQVAKGSKVPIAVPALADKALTGTVSRVPMEADPRSRTFAVEIDVANPERLLRAGMMARATLLLDRQDNRVVVPLDAVIDEPTATLSKVTNVVFVVEGGKAKRLEVKAGAMEGATVVIESGLEGGEQLIVVGQRRVVDGDPVRVVSPDTKALRAEATPKPVAAPVPAGKQAL